MKLDTKTELSRAIKMSKTPVVMGKVLHEVVKTLGVLVNPRSRLRRSRVRK